MLAAKHIEKPSGYKRWLKSAFSSEYQQVQAVKQELEALRKFDIIIIVDDSTSMKGEGRWTTVFRSTDIRSLSNSARTGL